MATSSSTRILHVAFFLMFLESFATAMILIALPSLILKIYDNNSSKASLFSGVAFAAMSFMQVFCNILYGSMTDYYGRRRFFMLAICGMLMSHVSVAIGMNVVGILFCIALRGLTDCTATVSAAIIGDLVPDELMGRAYSQLGGATGLGVILGPLAGALTALVDPRLPFIGAAFIMTIELIGCICFLDESIGREKIEVPAELLRPRGAYPQPDVELAAAAGPRPAFAPAAPTARVTPSQQHQQRGAKVADKHSGNAATAHGSLLSNGGQQHPLPPASDAAGAVVLATSPPSQQQRSHQKRFSLHERKTTMRLQPTVSVHHARLICNYAGNPFKTLRILNTSRFLLFLALATFLSNIALSGLITVFFLYTAERYGWTDTASGIFLFSFGFEAVLVQTLILPRVIPEVGLLGERKSCYAGAFAYMAIFISIGFATEGWMLYMFILIGFLAYAMGPATRGAMSKEVNAANQGKLQGAITFLTALAAVFGPMSMSGVFSFFVSDHSPVYLPGAPFFLGGLINFGALVLIVLAFSRHGHTRNAFVLYDERVGNIDPDPPGLLPALQEAVAAAAAETTAGDAALPADGHGPGAAAAAAAADATLAGSGSGSGRSHQDSKLTLAASSTAQNNHHHSQQQSSSLSAPPAAVLVTVSPSAGPISTSSGPAAAAASASPPQAAAAAGAGLVAPIGVVGAGVDHPLSPPLSAASSTALPPPSRSQSLALSPAVAAAAAPAAPVAVTAAATSAVA